VQNMRKYKRGEILAMSGEEGMVLCQCCQNMNQDSKNVKIKWLKPVLNGPENVFKPAFMTVLKDLSQIIDGVKVTSKGGFLHLDKIECKRLKDLHFDQAKVAKLLVPNDAKAEQKINIDKSKSELERVFIPETRHKKLINLAVVNGIVNDIIIQVTTAMTSQSEKNTLPVVEVKQEVNNNKKCYLPNCEVDIIEDFMFFSFSKLADLCEFNNNN